MNLGKHFVVRLVMRLKSKDGHKTHYASRRSTFRSASFMTYYQGKFVQTDNASLCPSLYLRSITRRTTNVCPGSSTRIMRLKYKNGHYIGQDQNTENLRLH